MSLTPTPLYCSECGCQQIEARKSYTVKAGGIRRLYYCPECKGYFSETPKHLSQNNFFDFTSYKALCSWQ